MTRWIGSVARGEWRVASGFAVAAVVALALPVSAQLTVESPSRWKVVRTAPPWDPEAVSVKVGFTTTLVDGKTGAATGVMTSDPRFRVGESMAVGIHSGSVQLCGDIGIEGPIDPDRTEALHAWNLTVQPTAVAGDKITLAVDWKRYDATPGGTHELGGSGRRTITLNEGEQHVLDFVSAPNASAGTCVNMMIQIEAALRDDPVAANTTLGYDLWLVDQESDGRQAMRHMEMAGRHREAVDFDFTPIGWSSDGRPVAETNQPDILVNVDGTIKGRLLPDGSVQLTVTPNRMLRMAGATFITHYEEKVLTAKPGETIRMDIPPAEQSARGTVPHRTWLSLTVRAWQ